MIPPMLRPRTPSTPSLQSPRSPPPLDEMMRFMAANRPSYRALSPPRTRFAQVIPRLPLHLIPCVEDNPPTTPQHSTEQYQEEDRSYVLPTSDRNERGDDSQAQVLPPRHLPIIEEGPVHPDSPTPTENDRIRYPIDPSKITITITNIPREVFFKNREEDHSTETDQKNDHIPPLIEGNNSYTPCLAEEEQEPQVHIKEEQENDHLDPAVCSEIKDFCSSPRAGSPPLARKLEPYFDESAEIDDREVENTLALTPENYAQSTFPDTEAAVQVSKETSILDDIKEENLDEDPHPVPFGNVEKTQKVVTQEGNGEDGNPPAPESGAEDQRCQKKRRRGTKRGRSEVETRYWLRSRKPASKSRKTTYWLRPSSR